MRTGERFRERRMLCANLRVGMEVGGSIMSPYSSRAKAPESPLPSGSTLLLDKKAMLAAHIFSLIFSLLLPARAC